MLMLSLYQKSGCVDYLNGSVSKNLFCHYFPVNSRLEWKKSNIENCSGFFTPGLLVFKCNFSHVLQSEFCTQNFKEFFFLPFPSDAFHQIIRDEGVLALWNGTFPSLLLVFNPAIQFMFYEGFKRKLLKKQLQVSMF